MNLKDKYHKQKNLFGEASNNRRKNYIYSNVTKYNISYK